MTATAPATDRSGVDLSTIEFWSASEAKRVAAFAWLRQNEPISWQKEMEIPGLPTGPGYWGLTRHADVVEASRHPELFQSGQGTNIPDLPEFFNEMFGSMINMDAPRHTRLRLIVNRGFTPRMVAKLEDGVVARARQIVDEVGQLGECDFVSAVAAPLPIQVICDMMGIPSSDHARMLDLSNRILAGGDEEFGGTVESTVGAGMELYQYAMELGEQRRQLDRDAPDDITSSLVSAEVDGERLTPQEFGSFFILLVVAGNETTRNAISHAMYQLTLHREQKRIWMDDFEGVAPTAIEEIVRHASPVIHFRRTATADTVLGGQKIAEGDKVVLWYNSANRDEDVFDEPDGFDVRRSPNEHVAFGGGGPHFCLGAHLARREIKVMFAELLRHLPDIEATAEPDLLMSNFIHGVKHLPVTFTAKAPRAG